MNKQQIETRLLGILAELETLHYEAVQWCNGGDAQRTNLAFREAREAVEKVYQL